MARVIAHVLLSISTTHRPATDLGFLLHKHPERAQAFTLPFGTAHVLYPEASEARCTAVLLLDIDPVGLTRRGGRSPFALAEYVNDRPYVASSLMSVALVTVFKTAMEGKAPELAQTPIPLTAELPAVPARGGEELVRQAVRAARLRGHGARDRQPPPRRAHARRDDAALRVAPAPVRAAAGAGRREALLGRHGRDREADATWRGLAARAPRASADHAPLPQARVAAREPGAGCARGARARRRPPGDRAGATGVAQGPAAGHGPGGAQGLGRAQRDRSRLRCRRAAGAPAQGRLHRACRCGCLCPRALDRRAAAGRRTPSSSCTAPSPTGTSGSRTTTPRRWSR